MLEFVSMYSRQFNDVNEDIVCHIREKDDMTQYIEEACKELQKALPSNITYLSFYYDDSGKRMREINKAKAKKGGKDANVTLSVSVHNTYARLAVFRFKVRFDDQSSIVEMPIYIPLFIDGYHYYIRGNKYSAPYQLTDAITYTNKDDMVVLKTMTRAIKISRDKVIVHDVHGHQYNSHVFGLYISSKRVALLLYYFAYYGFVKTAKYFGCEKFFAVYDECPIEPDPERIFFKFGSLFIGVDRKRFEDNYLLRQYIATCLSLSKKGINVESIQRVAYWKTLLGASISETKPLEKGTGLLYTFITALDHRTMINIRNLVGGSPKMTMFSVVRWMFMRYNHLVAKTGSLENKRLRLAEYIITPLIRVMYSKLYRFMNTSHKTKDVNRLLDIFKVSSAIILNAIIGKTRSKNLGLNIAKYSSYVNDMALLNVATKFTTAGPGSPMERSGKLVGASYRRFDTSSVGKVCLIATSNSDPGVSGSIVPSAQIDLKTMTFKSS